MKRKKMIVAMCAMFIMAGTSVNAFAIDSGTKPNMMKASIYVSKEYSGQRTTELQTIVKTLE